MNKRKILITGGAGFLGYHLAGELSSCDENEVLLLDNFSRGQKDEDLERLAGRPNVTLVAGDVLDPSVFNRLGVGFDEIYHLAAILGVSNVVGRPHEVMRVNALALLNVLEWFSKGGAKKLFFASTSEVYAWTQGFYPLPVPTPEDVPLALTDLKNPRSSYAASKIFGEEAVTAYGHACGKPYVIVRYHNVYGPRMGYDHVIPQLYTRALGGQSPLVVYSADHRRAFCYVADAVEATILAMRHDAAGGQTFNVGNSAEEVTIKELAERLLYQAGLSLVIEPRPAAHDPIVRRCPNIDRARNLLGFKPRVSLEEGLKRTLAWYGSQARHAQIQSASIL